MTGVSMDNSKSICWRSMSFFIFIWIALPKGMDAITCYKCESHRDYRCLDPFDYRPHISVNCDYESYVRDRNPVFCEKITELVNGVYITTRGCSTKQWEDLQGIIDHRGQNMRCIRNRLLESCFCTTTNCNAAVSMQISINVLYFALLLQLIKSWLWKKLSATKNSIPSDNYLNINHQRKLG